MIRKPFIPYRFIGRRCKKHARAIGLVAPRYRLYIKIPHPALFHDKPAIFVASQKIQLTHMKIYGHPGSALFSVAILSLGLNLFLTGCKLNSAPSADDAGIAAFSKDSLAAHIQTLASDSFQGRRPF